MTITLHIFYTTIEPQLFMAVEDIMSNEFEQTQPSSNTAQIFQCSKIPIPNFTNFHFTLQASMAQW